MSFIKTFQRYLNLPVEDHIKEQWYSGMVASFDDITGNVRVYIPIPGAWPRVVKFDSRYIAWCGVSAYGDDYVTIMKQLTKKALR